MPQPPAIATPARGLLTLALTVVGSGAVLVLSRQALQRRPLPTPATPSEQLVHSRRWDPDPQRRREASLLLQAGAKAEPARQRLLLAGQAWGSDPLAALVLKLDAQAATDLGQDGEAEVLWRQLLRRFPSAPATADALYALGRQEPSRRALLLQRFPAHPAALAAAVEAGPGPDALQKGALHLARWGARWPGAAGKIGEACRLQGASLSATARSQLAGALAELGDGAGALACLGNQPGEAATELALGRTLIHGQGEQRSQGAKRLLALSQRQPAGPAAMEATRLLSQRPEGLTLLDRLPGPLQQSAPVQARRAIESREGWQSVLKRWPADPASWELQWDLARPLLLEQEWAAAATVLGALPAEGLPEPQAARQQFWLAFAEQRQGQNELARRRWQDLLLRSPWGYYGWRAKVRLGQGDSSLHLATEEPPTPLEPLSWQPLQSGEPRLDQLWRLGQPLEAWEMWRHRRGDTEPTTPELLVLEGRLRQGVGDDWTGLDQLERANLRWLAPSCPSSLGLERSLHPVRFGAVFSQAAQAAGIDPMLLLAVAKQESRFAAAVTSPAGAIGLLQLMPATAAELAGEPLSPEQLQQPAINAPLGARYLAELLRLWQGNPFLAIASYNAGPGAVQGWLDSQLQTEPELWVEAIPFPETRLYTKKVLGNLWTYQQLDGLRCAAP